MSANNRDLVASTVRITFEEAARRQKEEEKGFVKGAAVGAVSSMAEAVVSIPELMAWARGRQLNLVEPTRNLFRSKAGTAPGVQAGFEMGNVTGMAAQVALDPVAVGAKAILIPLGAVSKSFNVSKFARRVALKGSEELGHLDISKLPVNLERLGSLGGENIGGVARLEEVLPIPDLAEALPALYPRVGITLRPAAEMKARGTVELVKNKVGLEGINVVLQEEALKGLPEDVVRSYIAHELQHGVQIWTTMSSRGTSPTAVRERLQRIAKAKGYKLPEDKNTLNTQAYLLYRANLGEQEARIAERLAMGMEDLPTQADLSWSELDGDTALWDTYMEMVKRQNLPEHPTIDPDLMKTKGPLSTESVDEEITRLIKEQAADAKAMVSRGGERVPFEVREAYKKAGVDYEKVLPDIGRDRNQTALPAQSRGTLYNAEGEKILDPSVRESVTWTQQAADPLKAAGLTPAKAQSIGWVLEETEKFSVGATETWRRGWNPEAFAAKVNSILSQKGGKKEFWVWDEAAQKAVVVKRQKDGTLFVGPQERGRPITREVTIKGKTVPNPQIDMIVESDAMQYVDSLIRKIERTNEGIEPIDYFGKELYNKMVRDILKALEKPSD